MKTLPKKKKNVKDIKDKQFVAESSPKKMQ